MKFYEKLQFLRKEKGFSQEELADRLGVSRQAVSKWESDMSYPETEKIIEISKIFGVTLDSLLIDGPIAYANAEGNAEQRQQDRYQGNYHPPSRMRHRYEYKSKRTLFGLPLVHVNVGMGMFRAKGVLAIGNVATGILSIGLLSLGMLSFGLLSVGLIAIAAFSVGLLFAIGSIAVGTIALGAIAIGYVTLGAMSIGVYSVGALSVASRIAIGDHANAYIAIGNSAANGTHTFLNASGGSSMPYDVDVVAVRAAIDNAFPNIPSAVYRFMTWFIR